MRPNLIVLCPLNQNIIQVTGMEITPVGPPPPSPAYINDATGLATLYDPNGNPVASAANIVLTYVPGSNGDYTGMIPATFDPLPSANSPRDGYTLFVDLDDGTYTLHREIPVFIGNPV